MTRRGNGGFTLIELLVSTTIAMMMASVAVAAFLQTRNAVNRAEARLAMHVSAQTLYTHFQRVFSGLMQSCAVVLTSTRRTTDPGTGATIPGAVSLTFMRGKESIDDWRFSAKNGIRYNSDLLWERWEWNGAKGIISSAVNQPTRAFQVNKSFVPWTASGADYAWNSFRNLPQPRRWLDPVEPFKTLDDNVYFPTPATPSVSLADVDDIGDYTDLKRDLTPVVDRIVSPAPDTAPAFALQVVAHDGTVTTVDDATTATTVLQGAWLDGRLAATVGAPQVFAGSDAAKRPKLIRVRFTMGDARTTLTQTFSFSFALPGMAPVQPGAVP